MAAAGKYHDNCTHLSLAALPCQVIYWVDNSALTATLLLHRVHLLRLFRHKEEGSVFLPFRAFMIDQQGHILFYYRRSRAEIWRPPLCPGDALS